MENAVSHLQVSLTWPADMVLQDRRGFPLIFLQQGELCAALGEECCFYVDHSGVVKVSMTKVREGLARCKKKVTLIKTFDFWFNSLSWLTILFSTILGLLLTLLLIRPFGPWVLNKLIKFIKGRLGAIHLLATHLQHQSTTQNGYQNQKVAQEPWYQLNFPSAGVPDLSVTPDLPVLSLWKPT